MEDKERFVRALVFLAKECGKELMEAHFELYCRAFKMAGFAAGVKAVEHLLLNRRDRDPMPTPRELLSIAVTCEDDPGNAEDIASRMVGAVAKFGHSNPESARKFMGELGWEIIQNEGGWSQICASMREKEVTIYKSQWKKALEKKIEHRAEQIIRKALAPGQSTPALPE